ncbi:hypothetical protein AURANDRAFT_33484, partial [Aureococcus anophagefferens]
MRLKVYSGCWDAARLDEEIKLYHVRTAPKIYDKIVNLSGFFIKLGQRLSLSRGVVPEPYVVAFRPLTEHVKPRPFEVVEDVFRGATGQPMVDAFEFVDHQALGSASLGQTHRARLRAKFSETCDNVVVKIQYPEVDETF